MCFSFFFMFTFTSRGCRISCRRGRIPGWSVYTKFLTEPRKRGSKITLGSARSASFALYQLGIPPTNISELVVNLPNWNSLPLDTLLCDTPSTVSVECSSFRRTCLYYCLEKIGKQKPNDKWKNIHYKKCSINFKRYYQSASSC